MFVRLFLKNYSWDCGYRNQMLTIFADVETLAALPPSMLEDILVQNHQIRHLSSLDGAGTLLQVHAIGVVCGIASQQLFQGQFRVCRRTDAAWVLVGSSGYLMSMRVMEV